MRRSLCPSLVPCQLRGELFSVLARLLGPASNHPFRATELTDYGLESQLAACSFHDDDEIQIIGPQVASGAESLAKQSFRAVAQHGVADPARNGEPNSGRP